MTAFSNPAALSPAVDDLAVETEKLNNLVQVISDMLTEIPLTGMTPEGRRTFAQFQSLFRLVEDLALRIDQVTETLAHAAAQKKGGAA